ncbi:hypothetical protein ACIHIX_34205 [Streptomyces sp. NPDC051913]|uniref:hypothetical protein n=1 Tax=Streptomyces sp. NPDC051913 TaxID=3365676 RepID=UPI0037D02B4E
MAATSADARRDAIAPAEASRCGLHQVGSRQKSPTTSAQATYRAITLLGARHRVTGYGTPGRGDNPGTAPERGIAPDRCDRSEAMPRSSHPQVSGAAGRGVD